MQNDESDFDIPAGASKPPEASNPPRQNLVAQAKLPTPRIESQPAPLVIEPVPKPETFAEALQLVQQLQAVFDRQPGNSRQQFVAWQRLETAKGYSKALQQLAEPPFSTMIGHPSSRPADLQHVKGLREQILAEIETK